MSSSTYFLVWPKAASPTPSAERLSTSSQPTLTLADLIPGAGGMRKLRWAASGRGKSGGARVITYWHCEGCPIYLITIYLKNERANLSRAEINSLHDAAKDLNNAHTKDPRTTS